ncbi:hypothetical protein BH09MYX1_BH09MYX1_45880 [soil metagenome]
METPAEKLRIAFAMHRSGVAMYRLTLARQNPSLSEPELDAKIAAWLLDRADAPFGDAWGTPRKIDP